MTLLHELHDQARDRGIAGYRKLSKAELEVALGLAEPPGPTTVEVDRRGALGLLRLVSVNGENALSLETLEAVADEAERLAADDEVRLVALIGSGERIFSAGADLAAVDGLDGAEVTGRGTAACERLAALPVPTIALLNGHAVGGGIDLALACDWRTAAQGGKLRFIHNELGYCPPWGGAQRLAALIGVPAALRLFATCELLSVDEARQIGILDAVVGREKLLGRADALAVRIARGKRPAVAETKRLMRPSLDVTAHEAAFARLWAEARA